MRIIVLVFTLLLLAVNQALLEIKKSMELTNHNNNNNNNNNMMAQHVEPQQEPFYYNDLKNRKTNDTTISNKKAGVYLQQQHQQEQQQTAHPSKIKYQFPNFLFNDESTISKVQSLEMLEKKATPNIRSATPPVSFIVDMIQENNDHQQNYHRTNNNNTAQSSIDLMIPIVNPSVVQPTSTPIIHVKNRGAAAATTKITTNMNSNNQANKRLKLLKQPRKQQQQQQQKQQHQQQPAVLHLLPWELQSIRQYRNRSNAQEIKLVGTCQPPVGIHESCCLGSFSRGGTVARHYSYYCFKGEHIYRRVAHTVLRELQRTNHMIQQRQRERQREPQQQQQREPQPLQHRRHDNRNNNNNNNNNADAAVNNHRYNHNKNFATAAAGNDDDDGEDEDDTTTTDCDVCRMVELIQRYDLRFAITGDSMMSQMVDGLFCELLRRGYHVTKVKTEMIKFTAMVGMKSIETHEITGGPPSRIRLRRRHDGQQSQQQSHQQRPVNVTFFFQYRPHTNMTEMIPIVSSYDVLVMNFGLHWGFAKNKFGCDKVGYEDIMTRLFQTIRRHGRNITLLAHRETSAQHNNRTGGEWRGMWGPDINKNNNKTSSCVALRPGNDSPIIGWRERVVQAKAQEAGYKIVVADETLSSAVGRPPASSSSSSSAADDDSKTPAPPELVILPFFNLTASLHYLHPDECTHFCSTPYLWMPIWRSLRLAMDRQWAGRGVQQ